MIITPKTNNEDFNRFLFEEIDLDIFEYKFLKDFISNVIKGSMVLFDSSVINKSSGGWIMILHGDLLLVYGNNWNENQLQEIGQIFDLNLYKNYTLAGDSLLINKLIEFYKPRNYEIEKHRLFYKSNEIKIFTADGLKIRNGLIEDANELAIMLQEYYHEEYNGINDKEFEEMLIRIYSVIQTNKIWVLISENNSLLSFCTIIDPDIGILFTKKEYRNKGYGKIILSFCAQLLHQRNGIVYLMTDIERHDSNKVCEGVGFKPYFNYVMTKINIEAKSQI